MCTYAIFGSQNALSMHVCKFSKGSACDVDGKYTLEVHINNLGNEGALIVHGCIFLSQKNMYQTFSQTFYT